MKAVLSADTIDTENYTSEKYSLKTISKACRMKFVEWIYGVVHRPFSLDLDNKDQNSNKIQSAGELNVVKMRITINAKEATS